MLSFCPSLSRKLLQHFHHKFHHLDGFPGGGRGRGRASYDTPFLSAPPKVRPGEKQSLRGGAEGGLHPITQQKVLETSCRAGPCRGEESKRGHREWCHSWVSSSTPLIWMVRSQKQVLGREGILGKLSFGAKLAPQTTQRLPGRVLCTFQISCFLPLSLSMQTLWRLKTEQLFL